MQVYKTLKQLNKLKKTLNTTNIGIYRKVLYHLLLSEKDTNRVSSKVKTSFRFILNHLENLGSIPNTLMCFWWQKKINTIQYIIKY